VALWRRGDQEPNVGAGIIAHLVGRAGRNMQALATAQHLRQAVHLQCDFTFQHIKELPRVLMQMALLGGAPGGMRSSITLTSSRARRCQSSQAPPYW